MYKGNFIGGTDPPTYCGGVLNEVVIVRQTTTHLLSESNTVFMSNTGDYLSYTAYGGTVTGSSGWITANTTYVNGLPWGPDVSIGGYNFGIDSNLGFLVGFNNSGALTTIGISSAGFTFQTRIHQMGLLMEEHIHLDRVVTLYSPF